MAHGQHRADADFGDAHLMEADGRAFRHSRSAAQGLYQLPVRGAELDDFVTLAELCAFRMEREIIPRNVQRSAIFHDEGLVVREALAPVLQFGACFARAEDQRMPELTQGPNPRLGRTTGVAVRIEQYSV